MAETKAGGVFYLCGSIHVLRPEDLPLPSAYDEVYAQSAEVVLELPPQGKGAGAGERMRELGTLPGSSPGLASRIPAAVMDRLHQWLDRRGLGRDTFERFQPWFVALIMVATEYRALGASDSLGVDQVYEDRALAEGKAVSGLETVDFQLQLFAGLTPEMQVEMLTQTLDEVQSARDELDRMIGLWRRGEVDQLYELMMREAEEHPRLMDRLLLDRNRAWVEKLKQRGAKAGGTMVVVGAGHLGGEQGLIALLRQEGMQVSPYLAWKRK